MNKYYEMECYKYTSEDWYPNYFENYVCVMYHKLKDPSHSNSYLVSVWGNDDCGMEMFTEDENKALTTFQQILGLQDVTRSSLKALGLVGA